MNLVYTNGIEAMLLGFFLLLVFCTIWLGLHLNSDDKGFVVPSSDEFYVVCKVWDNKIGGYRLAKMEVPFCIQSFFNSSTVNEYEFGVYRYEKVVIA